LPVTIIHFTPGSTTLPPSVYIDSNIIVYARNRSAPQYAIASQLLGELIVQGSNIYVSNLVLDEVWCTFLRLWHRARTGNRLNPNLIKQNPTILSTYTPHLILLNRKLLRIPNINFLRSTTPHTNLISLAMNLIDQEHILPRDSFHLALSLSNNIDGFITNDHDFDHLSIPGHNLTLVKI
jgi:predicted nucleic acid-binding protein